jgi:hypothetical protein
MLVTASLALAYLISAITFIIRWMHLWVRGPHFQPYVSIFVTMQAVFLLWWVCRHRAEELRFLSTVMYSMAAGYAAGLLAIAICPLFEADGAQERLTALQIPTIESAMTLFWFPVRLLTWLFGGMTGAILMLLSRRWGQPSSKRRAASP